MLFSKKNIANYKHCKKVYNDLGLELMRWQVDRVTGSSLEVGKFAQRYKDKHDQEPKAF